MASNNNSNISSKSNSSTNLSDKNELKKVFERFDKNGDGQISTEELAGVMSALGSSTSHDELTLMMDELDTDKDGFMNLDEFAEFWARKEDGDESAASELKDAFDMYDQDKNGQISASELHLVLSRLGERCTIEDCRRMIQSVDSDGDGNVNFEEFKKMMCSSKTSS